MNLVDVQNKVQCLETFPESGIVFQVIDELLTVDEFNEVNTYALLLDDLMSKLSENYDVVSHEQSTKILKWIDLCWKESDYEYTDLLISIVVSVEPEQAKKFISSRINSTKSNEIKSMLEEAYNELTD